MRSGYKEKKLEAKGTRAQEEERRAEKRREEGDPPHAPPRPRRHYQDATEVPVFTTRRAEGRGGGKRSGVGGGRLGAGLKSRGEERSFQRG